MLAETYTSSSVCVSEVKFVYSWHSKERWQFFFFLVGKRIEIYLIYLDNSQLIYEQSSGMICSNSADQSLV